MINVTKTFLPPIDEYVEKLKDVWETNWVTNQGPLAEELEAGLKEYLGVKNLLLVSNGTIAIQLAIKALDLKGEIITTPYSYAATTTSIIWENCTPVFCDIDKNTLCIDPGKIEAAITERTSAILPTHVYGIPCDVTRIQSVADRHNLKVIYDGAHAFGIRLGEKSISNYGDISTVSFHATKLFHTIEGGAVITNDEKLSEKMYLYRAFGHLDDEYLSVGINARTSEFHAAMGLCNLPRVDGFIQKRRDINLTYRDLLKHLPLTFLSIPKNIRYNYSYFPIFFQSEEKMFTAKKHLADNGINTRRYFFPSLNTLPYLKRTHCPVSEDHSKRVLCLPVYNELETEDIKRISKLISDSFQINV